MRRKKGFWTKDRAFKIAEKFSTKAEFARTESGAYYFLIRNNMLNDACKHMRYENMEIQDSETNIKDVPKVDYNLLSSVLSFVNSEEICFNGEIWKTHPIYMFIEASNLGRVRTKTRTITFEDKSRGDCTRTIKGKIIKQSEHMVGKGYLSHCIRMGGKKIAGNKTHQLIIECFEGVNEENLFVDHINGIRYDNRICNLRYVTPKMNANNEVTKQKTISKRKCSQRFSHYFEKYTAHEDEDFKQFKKNCFISNYGVIFLKSKNAYTFGFPNGDGYLMYGGKRVHRLVAEAFLPNPLKLPLIDHIDGDKKNNKLSNLRWAPRFTNAQNPSTKVGEKPVNQYSLDGTLIKTFNSVTGTGGDGFDFRLVSAVCLGKRKTHGGFVWKFKESEI